MIYEGVSSDANLRQGDIFRDLPRLEFSLSELAIVEDNSFRVVDWKGLLPQLDEEGVTAIVNIKPVSGIVITQDCDAARGQDVCLAMLDSFTKVTGRSPETAKSWAKLIPSHTRANLRYFYLPADATTGFDAPMAADFRTIIRLPRQDVEELSGHRVGRLNRVGYEHFRECLAQFFRRYPYNEWYPLSKDQAEAYSSNCPEEIELYDWQK